jgi:hypothetical protein
VKTIADVRAELDRKLSAHWHRWLTDTAAPDIPDENWPLRISLGRPDKDTLKGSFTELNRQAIEWQTVAAAEELELTWGNRSVRGTTQSLPTHLTLSGVHDTARIAGGGWPQRLGQAAERWATLQENFGQRATPKELRYVAGLSDVEFEMLVRAATWFRHNDATGLTPRQVPLEGVHGKWLNQHHACLEALSGRPSLGLTTRPSRILFTYLDPQHLAGGGRRHDSFTLGDTAQPAYRPQVAIICENKDTALLFPQVPCGVSIFGNGDAASRQLPHLPWLSEVPIVFYWGDIDVDGFECLNSLRAAGVHADSVLMDDATYSAYERHGSWTDSAGRVISGSAGKPLLHLTTNEDDLYRRLGHPEWQRVRRIEQERIPLEVGRTAVLLRLELAGR